VLTIEPARRPRRAGPGKLAVALAGGGPLGAFYELGALHALGEAIEGRALTDFDVYVGVSSGALAAAGLANGLNTATLGSIYIRDLGPVAFSPESLLRPATAEWLRRLRRLPASLLEISTQLTSYPGKEGWSTTVNSIGRLLPATLFDNGPLEEHLHQVFSTGGRTDSFRKLRRQLYVVATNINTAQWVAFGAPGYDRVAISRAVLASCALPIVYPPVEINGESYVDGALMRTMHASLALEAGCDLVICINPLVPFDASKSAGSPHANLAGASLPVILSQTFRALIHSRMQVGMASYAVRFPSADTLLLQPNRTDERLFFTNVFRYSGRHNLVEYAYQRTRRDLLANAAALARVLRRHGLRLNTQVLRERRRRFSSAGDFLREHERGATARLDRALTRLEGMLAPAADQG
jgi:predicted acylesterase/phospholipase RssA